MYKIKGVSAVGATIKFPKQSEINYPAVCILNELQEQILIPHDFVLKRSKALLIYEQTGGVSLKSRLAAPGTMQQNLDFVKDVLRNLFFISNKFNGYKLDSQGIVFRSDCIFVYANNMIKVMYAPGNVFDPGHSMDALVEEFYPYLQRQDGVFAQVKQAVAVFKTQGLNDAFLFLDTLHGDPTTDADMQMRMSEGATTVLTPAELPYISNEGATTVLNRGDLPYVSNEGATTVLTPNAQAAFSTEGATTVLRPANQNYIDNEGATTVLRPMDMPGSFVGNEPPMPAPSMPDPVPSMLDAGATTVLSAPVQSVPASYGNDDAATVMLMHDGDAGMVSADDFNENATRLIIPLEEEESAGEKKNTISSYITGINTAYREMEEAAASVPNSVPVPDPILMQTPAPIPEPIPMQPPAPTSAPAPLPPQEELNDSFSESETVMPGVSESLEVNRTIIGAEGLAQAMANSAIDTGSNYNACETVLMTDGSMERTAFFIRFVNSQAVYITKNYFTIGSGRDMDYVIQGNALVSRYHATIVIENDKYYIIDNNSTNKVYVDGRECVPFEKYELVSGAKVVLANEIMDFYLK